MEEWFDVCDVEGVPTGETVSRQEAHAQGIRHRTAHVWVWREREGKKEVLLQKRSQEKDSYPGCYDTSSAGHVPAGEEPLDSARRELFEELGIQAGEEDLLPVGRFTIQYEEVFHGSLFKDNEVSFVYAYQGEVDEKTLKLQEEEIEEVRWFPLEEVCKALEEKDPLFCVPPGGLRLIAGYLVGQKE